jgi:IS4 transposase
MLHQEVFDRVVRECPEAVMMRGVLENALPPEMVDEVFNDTKSRQYTRKLVFSTLVQLLSLVVCRVRPSVNAAYQTMKDRLTVSVKSVYNKLNCAEPQVSEALVAASAERMAGVVDKMGSTLTPLIPGYPTRILDGNHFAATEHRIKELRFIGGGPLPGQALAVYDADYGLVSRTYLCEDGHSQERDILVELLGDIVAGELWIADRNFATTAFMWQVKTANAFFIVRRHATNGRVRLVGAERFVSQGESGRIYEQAVVIEDGLGNEFNARLIRIKLAHPTRDGDQVLELLTNLPEDVTAEQVASAYRQRWRIETAFAELDRVFEGEIESLGHPRAALLAFSLGLISYNALSTVKAALRKVHGEKKVQEEVSGYYLGMLMAAYWNGLDLVTDSEDWTDKFAHQSPQQMARTLINIARHVDLRRVKKHRRGPKKPAPKRSSPRKTPHVSTARILAMRKSIK